MKGRGRSFNHPPRIWKATGTMVELSGRRSDCWLKLSQISALPRRATRALREFEGWDVGVGQGLREEFGDERRAPGANGERIAVADDGGSDFNRDFHATLDGTADPAQYMYRDQADLDATGTYYFTTGEQGGSHVFVRDGDRVFHTYTTYTLDGDLLSGIYARLDLTPFGRDPDPIRHHDRY